MSVFNCFTHENSMVEVYGYTNPDCTGFLLMQTLFWQSGHSWLINSFDEVSPDTFFCVFESACNQ